MAVLLAIMDLEHAFPFVFSILIQIPLSCYYSELSEAIPFVYTCVHSEVFIISNLYMIYFNSIFNYERVCDIYLLFGRTWRN